MTGSTRRSFSKSVGAVIMGTTVSGGAKADVSNSEIDKFYQFLNSIYKEYGDPKDVDFTPLQNDGGVVNRALVELVLQSEQQIVFEVKTMSNNNQIITPVLGKWSEEVKKSTKAQNLHKYQIGLSNKIEEMEKGRN